MLPYIFCYFITIFAAYCSSRKVIRIGKIKLNYIFVLITLIVPCYFAAVRAPGVGRDMEVYSEKMFEIARSSTNLDFYIEKMAVEPLFYLLTLACAKLGNVYVYYFSIQLLTILPILALLYQEEYKENMWIGIALYMFWLYPFSLNIMRQSIAIAFVIYGYRYIKNRQLFKYLVCCLVGMGFHSTAIVGLLMYMINVLVSIEHSGHENWLRKILTKHRKINIAVIGILSIACVAFCNEIVGYLSTFNVRYEAQLRFASAFGLDYIHIFLISVFVTILLLIYQRKAKTTEFFYLIYIIIIGAVLYQIKSSYSQMYRIAMYFIGYIFIAFPYALKFAHKREKQLFIVVIMALSLFNFWYYIIESGWHSVYPFLTR